MHDELSLAVVIRHVDIDQPGDAEAVRKAVETTVQAAGWDAEVSVDAVILAG